jgi:hypothetical protein
MDSSQMDKVVMEGLGLGLFEQDQANVKKNLVTGRLQSSSELAIYKEDAILKGRFTVLV